MYFIVKCFKKNNDALSHKLEDAGFSVDQAKVFLPKTASGIIEAINKTDLEIIIEMFLSDDIAQVLNLVDIDAIANVMGVKTDQVSEGLKAIAPVLSHEFKQQNNEIIEAIASLAWTSSDEISQSNEKLFDF